MNLLTELAEAVGISSSYIDKVGQTHETPDNVRRFFLKAMGYNADDEAKMKVALAELKRKPLLEDVLSFYEGEPLVFSLQKAGMYDVFLMDESGYTVWQGKCSGFSDICLPDIPFGYYEVTVKGNGEEAKSLLIYAPKQCYQPEFLRNKEHLFGTAVMLYALHSENSMGIGDFSDLAEIVRLTAEQGGDVVGVNPLGVMSQYTQNEERLPRHFLFGQQEKENIFRQSDVSPYRTLSRLFINYVYLDLRQEEDFQNSQRVQDFMSHNYIKAEINRLNSSAKVEYAKVLKLKCQILEMMFAHFEETAKQKRREEFTAYCRQKGEPLVNLCVFECMLEAMEPEDYWRYWQNGFADVHSQASAEFKVVQAERIRFYQYCHWLADRQVKNVQALAMSLGMKIGLYTDMPIGAASNGAEVWENPEVYVLETGIGAPADPMRPRGQSWGFTPYHPQRLKQQHYAPFIKLVRENMSYSGALRIDHAMGLLRLFWGFFTEDNPVVQGAYVYYTMKDMVAILALESQRRKCLVIGEDLGTVPEGFREYMAEHGLLSYKVFCRQKEKDGRFIRPEKYMYLSLAQTSTHDQATACGFWSNEDIEVFNRCHLYVNDSQYQSNLAGRKADRLNMIEAFTEQNMLSAADKTEMSVSGEKGDSLPRRIEVFLNQYGARTNSALYLVRLNDIYRQTVLDNAPGTVAEYPNWRIKMSHSIEEIKSSTEFAAMMLMIKQNRPRNGENNE